MLHVHCICARQSLMRFCVCSMWLVYSHKRSFLDPFGKIDRHREALAFYICGIMVRFILDIFRCMGLGWSCFVHLFFVHAQQSHSLHYLHCIYTHRFASLIACILGLACSTFCKLHLVSRCTLDYVVCKCYLLSWLCLMISRLSALAMEFSQMIV